MVFEINDYDGVIALVNADTYKTFVGENWTLEQLKTHFIQEMNAKSMVLWKTNNDGGGDWKIKLTTQESKQVSQDEFTTAITVTEGKLYLTDYTALTMAAQFREYGIPAKDDEKQYVELDNGTYRVNVKRFFDPDKEYGAEDGQDSFEIVSRRWRRKVTIH